MAQKNADGEPTLVERWLQDQHEWQKTAMAYLDSMVKNEQFLTHLGNAMRGSLLAGKPYPVPGAEAHEGDSKDGRVDEILHALHQIQGQLADLTMSVDELRRAQAQLRPQDARAEKTVEKTGRKGARAHKRSKAPAARKQQPAKRRAKPRKGSAV